MPFCHGLIGKITCSGSKIATADDFAELLLDAVGVAIVSGTAFGYTSYLRVSFTLDISLLRSVRERIQSFCADLK